MLGQESFAPSLSLLRGAHLWLLSLPHGFRCNPGFLRGHCAKVSRLEDKIAACDGNAPGLCDAES